MSFIFYLLFFYVLGIVLFITRKYDLFTIALIFAMSGLFLYFGKSLMFVYLLSYFCLAEGITMLTNSKHEKRNYTNLLGNCLIGTVLVVFGQIYASACTICAAFADTFSSEIGRLSKVKPRLITNFKEVIPGTNGGITILGLLGALLVSGFTFILFYFAFGVGLDTALVVSLAGMLGTLVDSVIGALLENRGYIDNAQTNFLTTLAIGCLAVLGFGLG